MSVEINLSKLKVGDSVKLNFNGEEKLWVEITGIDGNNITGKVDETPIKTSKVNFGDVFPFGKESIIDVLIN